MIVKMAVRTNLQVAGIHKKIYCTQNKTHFVYIYGPTFCLIFNFEKIDDRQILRHKHQYQCGEQTS